MPDAGAARALIAEIRAAGLRPLVIITPGQAPWLVSEDALDVELINEPDLAGWTPTAYRAAVLDVAACLGGRHRLWVGGVSNCTPKKLVWLLQAIQGLPPDIGVSVHRYPKSGGRPSDPQDGFKTREAEMAYLLRVVGGRRFGCSEWGYHTGPQQTGWWLWRKRWHWTDAHVADFAREEWAWWAQAGAAWSVLYQINDGLGDDALDRFGIRGTDGHWKPVAETFRG